MAQVESPATQKSLGINVLQGLGIEHVDARAKVWEIWSMVRHRLKVMGISVLWIDEAHDLFGSGSRREVDNMFKMLKSLMQGDHPVILILSGTERLAEITGIDPQINRRFTKIKPADLDEVADLPKVNSLVANFAKLAGLSANLDGLLGQRLVYASRARFGRLVETTIHAVERALIHGREAVCIEDFAQAWATQEGCDDDGNVFLSDHWYEIELDHYDDEVGAVTTAPKAKKARR
jgi:hypothetical protein